MFASEAAAAEANGREYEAFEGPVDGVAILRSTGGWRSPLADGELADLRQSAPEGQTRAELGSADAPDGGALSADTTDRDRSTLLPAAATAAVATSPHLVTEEGELKLDVAVGTSRRRFSLSDAAENLLRDLRYGYGPADVVPWVTTKALVFAGGATLPEGNDERDIAWELGGAHGGRRATEKELRLLAEFLRGRTVPDQSLDALREHVRSTGLETVSTPTNCGDAPRRFGG
jgi:hypothetical protein